jgi:carbon monoxide dehydrogenase subunit G
VELNSDFEVDAPIGQVWAVLTDVEKIAPCLPGAQLQEIEGDEFRGVVKIKVGPITAQYKGAASFVERDDSAFRAVLRAEGRDTRGAGNAAADITAQLETIDGGTRVTVTTDLKVTGKVAQFGRGVMADVSRKLMGQFADNLRELIGGDGGDGGGEGEEVDDGEAIEAPDPIESVRVIDAPEVEAIDLLGAAGAPMLKRLIPTLVVVVLLVALVVYLV